MKIQSIDVTEVRVPMKKGHVDSAVYGDASWKHLSKWIIELKFDSGMVGLGESPRGVGWGDLETHARAILGKRLDEIMFQRFACPQEAANDMIAAPDSKYQSRRWEYDYPKTYAYYGFECALFDAWGKASGLPVSSLMGGAWRDKVAVSFWIGRMTPDDAARQAALGKKLGFTTLKMKASIEDPLPDIIGAIKKAAGDTFPVVIDPNNRFFRLAEALGVARKLDRFEEIWFEDPFPYQAEDWREFRRESKRPLVWHTATPWVAIQDRSCDYFNLSGFSSWGVRFAAEYASHFKVPHWQGSGIDCGILDALKLHMSAASKTCVLSGDAIGHRIREDDLIVEEWKVENGEIAVPKGPGLGVTLDCEAVKRYQLRRETIR